MWRDVVRDLPLASRYGDDDVGDWARVAQALHERLQFHFVGMEHDDGGARLVCAQAALPVMRLGIEPYRHLGGVVIHRGSTVKPDVVGLYNGGVALSWDATLAGIDDPHDGYNVVLHEFAHVLDVGSRVIRHGLLPGSDGDPASFVREFAGAFVAAKVRRKELNARLVCDHALSHPQELFAFAVEFYFEAPHVLESAFPRLYDRLCDLLHQDPRAEQQTAQQIVV